MFLYVLVSLSSSRIGRGANQKYNRYNDPVKYLKELEFVNKIDDYDFAIVMFTKPDEPDCKNAIPRYRYAAEKLKGKAYFFAINAKNAVDLTDDLNINTFPTYVSFRYGKIVDKFTGKTDGEFLYWYVINITKLQYTYILNIEEANRYYLENNTTLFVCVDVIDTRLHKTLTYITTKFYKKLRVYIINNKELAMSFGIKDYPSINLMRNEDNINLTFPDDATKPPFNKLTKFITENIDSKYMLIKSFDDGFNSDKDAFFTAIFNMDDKKEYMLVRDVLTAVNVTQHVQLRYGDYWKLYYDLLKVNLQNFSTPLFAFFFKQNYTYRKWIYSGKTDAPDIVEFYNRWLRTEVPESVISTPIEKPKQLDPLRLWTGLDLITNLSDVSNDKDIIVNFIGFPCKFCDDINDLFYKCATLLHQHKINNYIFASVNASCNDLPALVWRNETYPFGWMFPAKNRSNAFPIGKRRNLYWMMRLLEDNSSIPFSMKNITMNIEDDNL